MSPVEPNNEEFGSLTTEPFCDNCGERRTKTARFCRNCGQEFADEMAPAASAIPQAPTAAPPPPQQTQQPQQAQQPQWEDAPPSAGPGWGGGGPGFDGAAVNDRIRDFFAIGDPVAVTPQRSDWGTRALAALIDGGIPFGIVIVGFILSTILQVMFRIVSPALGSLIGLVFLLAILGATVGFQIWNAIRQGRTGQTFGKERMGIAVVQRANGQVIGPGASIGRQLVPGALSGITCGIFGLVNYLWPLWDPDTQALHDKMFGTVVVRTPGHTAGPQ